MILYHDSNLVYTVFCPQFLTFQQNNSAQTSVLICFTPRHYYFFEKFKIVENQLCKLNCSYGKVSHALKALSTFRNTFLSRYWRFDYSIAFFMFIRKTIIPIKKCLIKNLYNFLKITTFIC